MSLALSMCLSLAKWPKPAATESIFVLHSGEVVLKSLRALYLNVLSTSCWLEKTKTYQESTPHKKNHFFFILGLNALFMFSHTSQEEYYWEESEENQWYDQSCRTLQKRLKEISKSML